jgi:hypothetical protein
MSKRKLDDDDDEEMSELEQLEKLLTDVKKAIVRFEDNVSFHGARAERYLEIPEGFITPARRQQRINAEREQQAIWIKRLDKAKQQYEKIAVFIYGLKQSQRRGERFSRYIINDALKELAINLRDDE